VSRDDAELSKEVRVVASRAIRRLSLLEFVILLIAAGLAMAAGAASALLLGASLGLPFRQTWFVASFIFFFVPALGSYLKERKAVDRSESRGGPELNRDQKEGDGDGR
jgi:hypothetical protein